MGASPEIFKVVGASGSRLVLENGQEVIDGISSWWVTNHGHCHPQIVEAVQKQVKKLDQVLFGNFSHDPAEQLIASLQDLLPSELKHFFFSDNGSTAVEVALKMVLQSCRQRGESQRNCFVAFKHSYHGDTVGAMSVGGPGLFRQPYEDMLFEVVHVNQGTRSTDSLESYVSDFKKQMGLLEGRVAAVIVEPLIQGAGGMIMWPEAALKEVFRVAREWGVYLIFDEVMTGFGRTGKNFAFEHIGETPDLLCLSKGLTGGVMPMSLTVVQSQIYDTFLSTEKKKMFFHGHSFTANPLACAAALVNSQLMREPGLKLKWERIHKVHLSYIHKYKGHPKVVDARLCGTVAALELDSNEKGYESPLAYKLTQRALKEGVFLRPLGNVLYVLPPYCITEEELEHIWSVISICLEEVV